MRRAAPDSDVAPGSPPMRVLGLALGLAVGLAVGMGFGPASCAPAPFEGTIDNAATGPRVASIARIERDRDRQAIPSVIECLASNDPVVREAAIRCLRSLTGETLDYRPDAAPLQRKVAVDRWVEWCRRQGLVVEGASSA